MIKFYIGVLYQLCRIPIRIIAKIEIINPTVTIIPTKDILRTVPQYLHLLALELTILPQFLHLICLVAIILHLPLQTSNSLILQQPYKMVQIELYCQLCTLLFVKVIYRIQFRKQSYQK